MLFLDGSEWDWALSQAYVLSTGHVTSALNDQQIKHTCYSHHRQAKAERQFEMFGKKKTLADCLQPLQLGRKAMNDVITKSYIIGSLTVAIYTIISLKDKHSVNS